VSRAARWLPRLAMLIGVILFTVLSRHWVTGTILGALVLASGLPRKGLELDRVGQLIVALVGAVGAWLLNLALVGDVDPLGMFGTIATLIPLLIGIPRLWLATPWLGERGTAIWATLVILGCGDTSPGPLFPLFVCLFLLVQLGALRAADPGRPSWARLTFRHRLLTVLALALATGIGLVVALTMPPAHDWVVGRIYEAFSEGQTGFSVHLRLGSLSRMLQSDKVVLRVHGPRPDYLRGYVYTEYHKGNWRARGVDSGRVELGAPRSAEEGQIRIDIVGGESGRYFLPLATRRAGVEARWAVSDRLGVFRAGQGQQAKRVWFELGLRDVSPVAPPDERDLVVPEAIAPRLREIARDWTAGEDGAAARLGAIRDELKRRYAYALSFERNPQRDPVIEFLDNGKTGHCEYFASALALLGRASGVPTRVVGGYRVGERNPLGDYHVVRELHAHAWVEAWLGTGQWSTVDATPAAEVPAMAMGETSFLAALADLIGVGLSVLGERIAELTWKHVIVLTAVLVALWLLVRLARRRRVGAVEGEAVGFGMPLPCFGRLLDLLERRGIGRVPSETLEGLARRLTRDPEWGSFGAEAARLIDKYAAHRYGGVGEASAVAGEIDRWIAGGPGG